MNDINPLGKEKVINLLIKFSVPAIVGMLVNSLYNFIDRLFIGNSSDLGTNGLAGITVSFPIMIILMSIGILFGIGGATLFSLKLGENKPEIAENALGNALFMMIITSLTLMLLGNIFLEPILIFFGASKISLPYASDYMRVIFIGSIFQVISMGMNNFIRADGNPKVAMFTMFIGAGFNIILDPIFIYVLKMGMAGAALATILAQFISASWVLFYFIKGSSKIKLKLQLMKPRLRIIGSIFLLGLPGFALQIANSLLNTILNKSLHQYGGDIAVSGMGIINSIKTLLIMPVIGVKQGVQPITSYNYGAKKYKRAMTAVNQAIIASTFIVLIGYLVTRLFPEQLILMFNKDPELVKFGTTAVFGWFLFMPIVGFQIIASSFFQAIGRSKTALFLTLTRQVILLIPALLVFPIFWELDGLIYATPFSDLFSAIITGIWFFIAIKRMRRDVTNSYTLHSVANTNN